MVVSDLKRAAARRVDGLLPFGHCKKETRAHEVAAACLDRFSLLFKLSLPFS